LIVGTARKAELIEACGLDALIVQPFDLAFAARSAEDFVRGVLVEALGAVEVVVGRDFTFGQGRRGTVGTLHDLGRRFGFEAVAVPPVAVDGLVVSSSKVRELVLEGRLGAAAMLLGRPFEVTGRVVAGMGRGRTLGIPTANVEPEGELLPPAGVYAAWAEVSGARHAAVVNIGLAPTFADRSSPAVEAHLLGYRGDLYGARVVLLLKQQLRGETRFASPDALVRQIHLDIARAGELLQ
jgi:riboflavin kinase/FMN adenylyltransferase